MNTAASPQQPIQKDYYCYKMKFGMFFCTRNVRIGILFIILIVFPRCLMHETNNWK